MTSVYINYPNPHFSVAYGVPLSGRRVKGRENQRVISLDKKSLGGLISDCQAGRYRFKPQSGLNDMWLEIDLGDEMAEKAALREIQSALGEHYEPLKTAEWRFPAT